MKKIPDIKSNSDEVQNNLNIEVTRENDAAPDGGIAFVSCEFGAISIV